jgi:hypothetical protein
VVACSNCQASSTILISWEPSMLRRLTLTQQTLRGLQQEARKTGLKYNPPLLWLLCWRIAKAHQPKPPELQRAPRQRCSSWTHTRNYSSIIFPSWPSSQTNATTSCTSLTSTGNEITPKMKDNNNRKAALNLHLTWSVKQRSTFA